MEDEPSTKITDCSCRVEIGCGVIINNNWTLRTDWLYVYIYICKTIIIRSNMIWVFLWHPDCLTSLQLFRWRGCPLLLRLIDYPAKVQLISKESTVIMSSLWVREWTTHIKKNKPLTDSPHNYNHKCKSTPSTVYASAKGPCGPEEMQVCTSVKTC